MTPRLLRHLLVLALCTQVLGCAFGNVRSESMGALGAYRRLPVRVEPARGHAATPELSAAVAEGVTRGLRGWSARSAAPSEVGTPALVVEPVLLEAHPGRARDTDLSAGMASAASVLGLQPGFDANQVSLRLVLRAPDQPEPLGVLLWDGAGGGSLNQFAPHAAEVAGQALASKMLSRADQFVTRRAGDERFVLAPSSLLLEPGEITISDDEVLLLHIGVGVTRWLELHLTFGGLPLPAAGAIPIVGHGVGGAGGAGLAVVGAVEFGVRFRLLEETARWPGIATGVDLVDAFGAALGGGAIFFAGNGIGALGGAGVAGVNVQLNVLHVEANKHFGPINVGGGVMLIDNHHVLPQSAGFAVGIPLVAGEAESHPLEMMPEVWLPFVDFEYTPVPWFRMIQELYPQAPVRNSFAATGLRFVLGPEGSVGAIDLERIRMRIDLAILESFGPGSTGKVGFVPLPWLGLGFYFL